MAEVTPFQIVPPKKGRPKKSAKSGGGEPPDMRPPKWPKRLEFPDDSSAILKKTHLTKKQFSKYAEQFLMYIVTYGSADYFVSLMRQIRRGDKEGMKAFAQIMGLVKNESAVTVNLHQNNLSVNSAPHEEREFSSIVRMLDQRDRTDVIDATPLPVLPEIEAEIEEVK